MNIFEIGNIKKLTGEEIQRLTCFCIHYKQYKNDYAYFLESADDIAYLLGKCEVDILGLDDETTSFLSKIFKEGSTQE